MLSEDDDFDRPPSSLQTNSNFFLSKMITKSSLKSEDPRLAIRKSGFVITSPVATDGNVFDPRDDNTTQADKQSVAFSLES